MERRVVEAGEDVRDYITEQEIIRLQDKEKAGYKLFQVAAYNFYIFSAINVLYFLEIYIRKFAFLKEPIFRDSCEFYMSSDHEVGVEVLNKKNDDCEGN